MTASEVEAVGPGEWKDKARTKYRAFVLGPEKALLAFDSEGKVEAAWAMFDGSPAMVKTALFKRLGSPTLDGLISPTYLAIPGITTDSVATRWESEACDVDLIYVVQKASSSNGVHSQVSVSHVLLLKHGAESFPGPPARKPTNADE